MNKRLFGLALLLALAAPITACQQQPGGEGGTSSPGESPTSSPGESPGGSMEEDSSEESP
ncbi:MAG: hypothetical protein BRC41_09915 [Cyanobacteria bacterium QH_9_48_43]|nr:MAG: hypothetical protein BRC34_12020 [Cyanobacteria bacterium QH_1_48_107]PSO55222.1 MAG: hypothetical protein BRC35_12530 [Cyanobacteria bacterium QH_10_48_56]PSO60769.1 MAG: hypothetical protein BRC36_13205 [Cyanobacteria bacterium QH_2_48_84]PSO75521.1 MAG: hypothetical protein BRC37_05015 [Cyanobacteria bacterium QH_3_48_40]PSO84687.1 MAG: hypothetical protein BRC41_09915 [Cyanobacteria bacterium QH_9_48_43]PSP10968.1 MAG: hypothetical protein BRC49_08900 [Cyanobacteria bacterium SW_10